jgi:hypothetical protein
VIQIWKLQIWKRNPNLEITDLENFNKDLCNQLRMETKYGNYRSEKLKQRFSKSMKFKYEKNKARICIINGIQLWRKRIQI